MNPWPTFNRHAEEAFDDAREAADRLMQS